MITAPSMTRRMAPWAVIGGGLAAALLLAVAQDSGANALNHLLLYAPGVDKVLHFGWSALLFLGFYVALGRTTVRHRLPVAAAMAVAAACLDEAQQQFAAGRSIEAADVMAGVAGIAFGCGLLLRRSRPVVAIAAVAGGLALGVGLTYDSYRRTHDYNAGLLAERDGRMADAAAAYLRAIHAGVERAEVYNAAAWALAESGHGDIDDAVAFAERSLAMRPGDPDTLDTYGWTLYRAGRPADALDPLEQALALKPDIYCIHYHLAMVLLMLGRRDDAIPHLRLQVALMPRTAEARLATEELSRLGLSPAGTE